MRGGGRGQVLLVIYPKILLMTPLSLFLLFIAGWGIMDKYCSGGVYPSIMQEIDMEIYPEDQCESFNGTFRQYNSTLKRCTTFSFNLQDKIINHVLCAQHPDPDKTVCHGDSGGPLTVSHQGKRVLVGIVSAGYGCGLVSFVLDPCMSGYFLLNRIPVKINVEQKKLNQIFVTTPIQPQLNST